MRPSLLALPLVLVAPLGAQNFEGTVSLKFPGAPVSAMTWNIKGSMSLATFASSAQSKTEVKYVLDHTAQTNTVLLPLPGAISQIAPDVKGMRMVNDLRSAPPVSTDENAPAAPEIALRPLGTSQTIAGMRCDDYELSDSAKTRACLSGSLGSFVFPSMTVGGGNGPVMAMGSALPAGMVAMDDGNGRTVMLADRPATVSGSATFVIRADVERQAVASSRQSGGSGISEVPMQISLAPEAGTTQNIRTSLIAGPPAWSKAIHGAGFPLKVWIPGGKVLLEATAITRGPVADSLFMIPDGYIDPSELGATMRRSMPAASGGGY